MQVDEWNVNPKSFAKAHWINTSSNSIVRNLIKNANEDVKEKIESLISGGSIEAPLKENITYGDMDSVGENIWSFLFFTGYLKMETVNEAEEYSGEENKYTLVIPNVEVKYCYKSVIREYFNEYKSEVNKAKLFEMLLNKDAEGFAGEITKLLQRSISFFDSNESFYHGLVAGLISPGAYFELKSNRETGEGRSDIVIYQQDRRQTAIIIELKICPKNEFVDDAAKRALEQINERDYAMEARETGYKEIIKYGVAFKNKMCYAIVECEVK